MRIGELFMCEIGYCCTERLLIQAYSYAEAEKLLIAIIERKWKRDLPLRAKFTAEELKLEHDYCMNRYNIEHIPCNKNNAIVWCE